MKSAAGRGAAGRSEASHKVWRASAEARRIASDAAHAANRINVAFKAESRRRFITGFPFQVVARAHAQSALQFCRALRVSVFRPTLPAGWPPPRPRNRQKMFAEDVSPRCGGPLGGGSCGGRAEARPA